MIIKHKGIFKLTWECFCDTSMLIPANSYWEEIKQECILNELNI